MPIDKTKYAEIKCTNCKAIWVRYVGESLPYLCASCGIAYGYLLNNIGIVTEK